MVETERVAVGEEEEGVRNEGRVEREREERRLTDDLKEKVRTVEELWGSALGGELEGVEGRVRAVLEMEGGWEGMDE